MWMRWQQSWSGCRCVACCWKPPPGRARSSTRPSSIHHSMPTRFSEEWPRSPSRWPSHQSIVNEVSRPTRPSRRMAMHCLKSYLRIGKWKNAMPCRWCIYKQMLSLNRKKIKFISKIHYLLAHYMVTFHNSRSLIVTHKKPSCASHVVTFRASHSVTSN